MTRDRREILVACAAVLGALALFAGKAFTMDDTLFLKLADHVTRHPLDFFGFDVNWYGSPLPMHEVTKNPPLVGYYIAAVRALLGTSEIALHLAFLVPAGAVVVCTYRLAARLCESPLLATLIGLTTPVFLVSSTNVMSDTTMLAFWCASILCWVRGFDAGRSRSRWWAGVWAGAAIVSKYFGLALIPLLLAHGLLRTRRLGAWLLPLAVPVGVALGYQVGTDLLEYGTGGRGLLLEAGAYATEYPEEEGVELATRIAVGFYFAGGCLIPALFFAPLAWPRWATGLGLASVALSGVSLVVGGSTVPPPVQVTLLGLGGASFLGLVVAEGVRARRSADAWLLVLWLAGTYAFAAHLNWTNNGRSNLPAAPALGIVLVRHLDARRGGAGTARWLALAPGVLVGLAVAHADMRWANDVRAVARELTERYADPPLWFQGHWGFQYYMEQGGARPFDLAHDRLAPGERMVFPPRNVDVYAPAPDPTLGRVVGEVHGSAPGWVHTFRRELGASFYAANMGPLPFVFGRAEADAYPVFQAWKSFQIDVEDPHHGQGPGRAQTAPEPGPGGGGP